MVTMGQTNSLMVTNITNISTMDSKYLQLCQTSSSIHGQLPGSNHSRVGRMDRLRLEEEEELREWEVDIIRIILIISARN